jgi:uncharacterized protein (TIGR02594 family)
VHKKPGANEMRFKTRMTLTIGCVSLLALSIPAFSHPSPQANAHKQSAAQKNRALQHAAIGHAKARAAREERAARLVSRPITEPPKRPLFGWPALVSEARKYLGTNPTARSRLWCATFMNLVLAKVGYAGTNSDAAKSFAAYGHRVSEPEIGAIAVLSRGKNGGHVGVVSGIDKNGNPIIISGNHGHQVGEAIYPRSRVIAYVMPSDRSPGSIQLAARSQPSQTSLPNRPAPEHHIESPIAELLAAIEAERNRPERPSQPAPQAQPAEPRRIVQQAPPQPTEPHRTAQQMPEPMSQSAQRARLPLAPALAELLGLKDRAQAAPPPPRPAPQRQRQVQQNRPGRVAGSDAGLAAAFSFR